MADSFHLDIGQRVQSDSKVWYQNIQLLGIGGNAVTFLTTATSGPYRGVLFAVKVFKNLSRPERRESFLNEIRFLEHCNHPAIMRVFDSGVFDEQHPFVVAEYLPRTLDDILKEGQSSTVIKISHAMELLSALAYLENLRPAVIHRDIKPQNVFVKGRSCILGDFGLMKQVDMKPGDDREVLKESIGFGMPRCYRTPDQVAYLKGESRLTPKSDVFQLGLVLAELFTGRNPEKPAKAFTDPVELEPLASVPGRLSASIASALARMLELKPDARDNAESLLDIWEAISLDAIRQAHALEGKAIW